MLTNPSPKLTNLPEAGDEEEEDEGPATAGPVVIPRILAPRVLNFASDPHVDYDRIVELDYSVLEGGVSRNLKICYYTNSHLLYFCAFSNTHYTLRWIQLSSSRQVSAFAFAMEFVEIFAIIALQILNVVEKD